MFCISVYVPSCNQRQYLGSAIESLLSQTRVPDQILIVDDASTDGSQQVIRDFEEQHPGLIHSILFDQNQGIGAVRASAIEHCTGDLLTYLDADDYYEPMKIELEEQALCAHPEAGWAYSNFNFVSDLGNEQRSWSDHNPLPSGNLFEDLASFRFPKGVSPRCALIRKEIFDSIDSYEPGMNMYQTLDVMLRVSRFAQGVAINQPTHVYRQHHLGIHRKAYKHHYHALKNIFHKNRSLLDDLPIDQRARIEMHMNQVLSQYAWRSVKEIAQSNATPTTDRDEVIKLAGAGASHRRRSVLNPKHLVRTMRACMR